jgi:hypothetical protein
MSESEVVELLEFIEASETEELVDSIPASVAAEHDVRLERIGSAVALAVLRWDVPMLNRVVGIGLRESATEEMLAAIDRLYRAANVRYMVQVAPGAKPDQLPSWLEARNLPRLDNWAKLIRGDEAPVTIATDLRVERVGPEYAEAFARIVCAGFELPDPCGDLLTGLVGRAGWYHYMAFDEATPVACGALYVRDGVGWLDYGATLETHRRRGAQGAIMAQRIRDALDLGCHHLGTEAEEDSAEQPNPSYHNMLRTGFRLAFLRPNYIFFPAGS